MRESTFKCSYYLEQQTPLLHFQHSESRAALRASEVKPMLDRFMQKFIDKYNISVPKDWYLKVPCENSKIKPFDYKMSVRTDCDSEKIEDFKLRETINKLYFAKGSVKPLFSKVKDAEGKERRGVYLEILCFNQSIAKCPESLGKNASGLAERFTLSDLIGFVLPAFFSFTCFGTRATKGFGSFNVVAKNGAKVANPDNSYLTLFVPIFYIIDYGQTGRNYAGVLEDIWVLSGLMKSGFNFVDKKGDKSYYKGKALSYLLNEGIGADKAFVKQKVLIDGKDRNKSSEDYKTYTDHRFVRAMLGLPQIYVYRASKNTTREGTVKIASKDIERFASPIRFVLNGNKLFIVPDEIPEEMFKAGFLLAKEIPDDRSAIKPNIFTPKKEEFNLISFLDSFAKSFNKREKLKPDEFKKDFCIVRTDKYIIEKVGESNA